MIIYENGFAVAIEENGIVIPLTIPIKQEFVPEE